MEHRNLALLLLQARECVMSKFRRILNYHGLTEQQWRIIRELSEQESMEQWQICEACQIVSPSLAGVLARMEEMQLVTRSRVDSDQRRIMVSLTPKSRALVSAIAPLIERQYAHIESAVGTDTVQHLYRALDDFLAQQDLPVTLVELPAFDKNAVVDAGQEHGGKSAPTAARIGVRKKPVKAKG
ncbi:homoprotocatechuate degradation operon regulator HpaR [Collimonas silvisoli]|uniref:homoprotocatechuate degradation operon regulator HpaR n=1 Tax=Collimonas silvisoli TaxID=2825884 RepID=UPI001B8D1FBF|nr:homoprotocatechuate degradation operon regulator HpaR [Collimonas silvisoli]